MLANIRVETQGQQRLRVFLIVLRWLSFLLGILMTQLVKIGSQPHALPSLFQKMPIILFLLLGVYHLVASLVCFSFDNSKFNVGFLIFLDICVGGFMAWFYGLPYFMLMIVLPVIESAFYFGSFVSIVVLIMTLAFFGPLVLGQLVKVLATNKDKEILVNSMWNQVFIFVFSCGALYLSFLWSLKQEEEVNDIVKKFQEEKRMLFESHQATKKEFTEAFSQVEEKDNAIQKLELTLSEVEQQLLETQNDLDIVLQENEELKQSASKTERFALESQKKILLEQKKLMEDKDMELEELRRRIEEDNEYYQKQLEEEIEIQRAQLVDQFESEIQRYQVTIDEMESNVGANEAEYVKKIGELEQKIQILVKKIADLSQAIKSRETMLEAFDRMISNPELDSVYLGIIEESLKMIPSQTALLFMVESENDENYLFAEVAATPYQSLFVDYSVEVGEGAVGWSAEHSKPLIISDGLVKMDDRELSTLIRYEKSALMAPIIYDEGILGVLYLGKPDAGGYKENDLFILKKFCKLAGSAINASLSANKSAANTLTEEETGLYNELYFFERYNEEVERSLRYNIPMTLVLMEILNYEKFAETSEKFVLNRMIMDLSEILRSNVRETDVVARLSNEQFAVLFVHSNKPDTILVAERIRMASELRSFGSPQAKSADLHLCIGLANLPEDSDNNEEIYELATKYLEEAKRRGGTQICFAP